MWSAPFKGLALSTLIFYKKLLGLAQTPNYDLYNNSHIDKFSKDICDLISIDFLCWTY